MGARVVPPAAGLATLAGAIAWAISAGDGPARLTALDVGAAAGFVLLAMLPFLALSAAAMRLGAWPAIALTVVFAAFEAGVFRDGMGASSPIGPVMLLYAPVALLATVPPALALVEAVRLIGRRRRGDPLPAGGWRYAALAAVLGAAGFALLSLVGLTAGLAVAFVIWAAGAPKAEEVAGQPAIQAPGSGEATT
jgi:hypothetical protein